MRWYGIVLGALLCTTAMKRRNRADGRQRRATRKRGKANHANTRKRLRHERAQRAATNRVRSTVEVPDLSAVFAAASNLATLDLAGFDPRSVRLNGSMGLGGTEQHHIDRSAQDDNDSVDQETKSVDDKLAQALAHATKIWHPQSLQPKIM